MEVMDEAVQTGLSIRAACAAVGVSERRFRGWRERAEAGDYARHPKPLHVRPVNALTEEEHEMVREAVASTEWVDSSCRELSVKVMERHGRYISPYSFWLYETRLGIAGHRGKRRRMGVRRPQAPDTSFATGPNMLWTWDITKLRTDTAYRFIFLYVVLDQWSRKVVGWHLSHRETSSEGQAAWDLALTAEGIGLGESPKSLSDRGSQMRSRSTTLFFRDLGVGQLFARPRTPNDNPFIESFFSTVKTAPAYPGYFRTLEEAFEYFKAFFLWYNTVHLHTRIGMVTPEQRHNGAWVGIQEERRAIKAQTMAQRRAVNCRNQAFKQLPKAAVS